MTASQSTPPTQSGPSTAGSTDGSRDERLLNVGVPAGHTDRLSLPLGRGGSAGRLVEWNPERQPHMMLTGLPGSGKSAFCRTVMMMALLKGWRVWMMSPYASSVAFGDWPGVERFGITGDELRDALIAYHRRMQHTYAELRAGRIDAAVPTILIVDDAMAGLNLGTGSRDEVDPQELQQAQRAMSSVARGGRGAMTWILLSVPAIPRAIPAEMRDNLRARAVAGSLTEIESELMFDAPAAYGLPRRNITIDVGGGPAMIQPFWTPDPCSTAVSDVAALRDLRSQVERAQSE